MKEAAQIIAESGGYDEVEIHTKLRGWNQGEVARPEKKSGLATSPLLYSQSEIIKLAALIRVQDNFRLRPRMMKYLFSWINFEPKIDILPDGTQISHSIDGAIKGIAAKQKWAVTISPYRSLREIENGTSDPDSWSLIFSPSNGSTTEIKDEIHRVPLNPILEPLLERFRKEKS